MSEYGEKYPWLRLVNMYSGKLYANKDAMDDMPEGWKIAFGDMMCAELNEAINSSGVSNTFVVLQVKEKFGSLIFRHNQPQNKEIDLIVRKYCNISRNVCLRCGRPNVPMVYAPWIRPMCKECYVKTEHTDGVDYDELIRGGPSEITTVMSWEEFKEFDEKSQRAIYESFNIDISETVSNVNRRWLDRVVNGTNVIEQSKYDKTFDIEDVMSELRKTIAEDFSDE